MVRCNESTLALLHNACPLASRTPRYMLLLNLPLRSNRFGAISPLDEVAEPV